MNADVERRTYMSVRSFFDTNILIYADDKFAPAKQKRAIDLVTQHRRAGSGVVSMQVLQEYFVTVTRKLGVDAKVARRKVELRLSLTLPRRMALTFLPPSTCTAFTAFLSGMPSSCDQLSRPDAVLCLPRTFRTCGKLMACAS